MYVPFVYRALQLFVEVAAGSSLMNATASRCGQRGIESRTRAESLREHEDRSTVPYHSRTLVLPSGALVQVPSFARDSIEGGDRE